MYGQGDLSIKVNDQPKPAEITKNSWSDTTLGWSTTFQYHQKCLLNNHTSQYALDQIKKIKQLTIPKSIVGILAKHVIANFK